MANGHNNKTIQRERDKKGMCSNEQGITVASNVGKVYERIINNRALKQINITDAQAGGKEGRSTTDHLLILKEIINTQKGRKNPSYKHIWMLQKHLIKHG